MKKNEIMKSVGLTFNKIGFQIQKKSPELLVAAGIAGVVVSAVMACKATIKASEVAEETKDTIDEIHEIEEQGVTRAGNAYSVDDAKKDLTTTYLQTGVKYAKLYAPSVILGAASITCIVASHRVLKKRNIALAAAYTTLDKSFKEYRGRVMERFGEQVEKEIRYNIKAKEIKKTVVDETGKKEKVKEVVDTPAVDGWDPSQYSPYARRFDETHPNWTKIPDMNLFYLKARQAQANDMLKTRGHLFLNEVYDLMVFPRTKAGAVVGWLYDPKRPELGDPYVDFGMYEIREGEDFESYTKSYILDFNVVGDITNDIADHQNI
ncbi:DUF6353 family protein [uncultured Muribaculum sp.]|uniref:DUF6353 family protein n=1 Tax=uncultured Muribaculum sp. TaxID=1918613 RepID=UPI00266D31A9|nr:DUF6353 family protein [uncultured Muribaculum sp.]